MASDDLSRRAKALLHTPTARLAQGPGISEQVAVHFSGKILTLIPLDQDRKRHSRWVVVTFATDELHLQVEGMCTWTATSGSAVAVVLALRRSGYDTDPGFVDSETFVCGQLSPSRITLSD